MYQHSGVEMENCLAKNCHLGWVNLWENFCKNILVVVTSGIHTFFFFNLLLNCIWDQPLVFISFFVHRSTLQLFSLPRRKWMYNFQCSAAYQMDVTSWPPQSLSDTRVRLILPPVNVKVHLLCGAHNSGLICSGMQRWQGGPADLGQTWRAQTFVFVFL